MKTKFFKKTEGFTLVELIVVIAILGILAGVGTVGYSGYIKKANMAADQQLVSSIANGLIMQTYSNPNGEKAGYVLLSSDADAEASGLGVDAMQAAFGNGWESVAKLSYGEWSGGNTDFLKNMDYNTAKAVTNSSFLTGSTPTELLGEVSTLTNTAFGFVTKKLGDSPLLYSNMKGNFGASGMTDEEFNEQCAKYGISTKKDEATGTYYFDNTNQTELATQLSNFMVMAAAEDFAKAAKDESGSYQPTVAAELVLMYASYNAVANSSFADAETKAAYAAMGEAMKSANSLDDVMDAMEAFENNSSVNTTLDKYEADPTAGDNDSLAITNIMETVGNATDIVTADDIKNSGLYSSGSVADYFNSYVASAGLVAGLTDEAALAELKNKLEDGTIAVYVSNGNVGCTAMDAYRPR